MKRLMLGVYDDERGGLHIDMAEFLAANGYPDTPENRDTFLAAVRHTFGGEVTVTDAPVRRRRED